MESEKQSVAGPAGDSESGASFDQTSPSAKTEPRVITTHTYNTNFYGVVYDAYIGPMSGFRQRPTRRIGRIAAADVEHNLAHFIPPPALSEATRELTEARMVTLAGESGSGRRCGAFAALRSVIGGDVLVLPPRLSVAELSDQPFEAGLGYLAEDVDEAADADDEATAWSTLRTKLSEIGSYLMLTVEATRRPRRRPGRPAQLLWTKPDLHLLARSYLGPDPESEVLDVLDTQASTASMFDLQSFLIEVASGTPVTTAAAIFNLTAEHAVADWFDAYPELTRLADVTVATFFPELEERDFELLQHALLTRLDTIDSADAPPLSLTGARRERWAGNSLLCLRQVESTPPRRFVYFKAVEQREFVLAELDRRFDRRFWQAASAWLDDVVEGIAVDGDDVVLIQIALALALLGRTALAEVQESYLDPWSVVPLGGQRQRVVVYVLYWMSRFEGLDGYALALSRKWIRSRVSARRATAATVLGGDLGLIYPSEAVNQLWRLLERHPEDAETAAGALAGLFAALVAAESSYASRLVAALNSRLADLSHNGFGQRRILEAALLAAVQVLSVRRSRRASAWSLVLFRRATAQGRIRIGELWSTVLLDLYVRGSAANALVRILRSLDNDQPEDVEIAGALGEAIRSALRPDQVGAIQQVLVSAARGRTGADPSVMSILMRWFEPPPALGNGA